MRRSLRSFFGRFKRRPPDEVRHIKSMPILLTDGDGAAVAPPPQRKSSSGDGSHILIESEHINQMLTKLYEIRDNEVQPVQRMRESGYRNACPRVNLTELDANIVSACVALESANWQQEQQQVKLSSPRSLYLEQQSWDDLTTSQFVRHAESFAGALTPVRT